MGSPQPAAWPCRCNSWPCFGMLHPGRSSGKLCSPPQHAWRAKTLFVKQQLIMIKPALHGAQDLRGGTEINITKQENGQRNTCSRGLSLFWSKGACTEIILPGLIKRAVANPSNTQGTLFSRSKTWFPPYRSCPFLHCSYSSLRRWQMQRRRLQITSVTTSASTFVSGAFYSHSTEPNPEF